MKMNVNMKMKTRKWGSTNRSKTRSTSRSTSKRHNITRTRNRNRNRRTARRGGDKPGKVTRGKVPPYTNSNGQTVILSQNMAQKAEGPYKLPFPDDTTLNKNITEFFTDLQYQPNDNKFNNFYDKLLNINNNITNKIICDKEVAYKMTCSFSDEMKTAVTKRMVYGRRIDPDSIKDSHADLFKKLKDKLSNPQNTKIRDNLNTLLDNTWDSLSEIDKKNDDYLKMHKAMFRYVSELTNSF